jgi:hypothetical protein
MATVSMAYDHPTYTARENIAMGEGGGSLVAFAKFVATSAVQAYAATYTVSTAGTNTGALQASLSFVKVSGTTTTTMATTTVGTNAAWVTSTTVLLTTASAGGVALAQGDLIQTQQGTDSTLRGVVSYQIAFHPLASVTA